MSIPFSSSADDSNLDSPLSPPLPLTNTITENTINRIGFGYAIAFAFGFLVLLSAVFLVFYTCCRRRRNESQAHGRNPNYSPDENGVYLPRIIFVSEGENDDEASSGGLEHAVINSYPKFKFSKTYGNGAVFSGNETVCSICLCDYKEAEMLRLLPDCKHYFHVTCIDAWLKLNASCPVCRNSPLPTPLATPLSEVVPLSQYAGGRRRP